MRSREKKTTVEDVDFEQGHYFLGGPLERFPGSDL